MPNELAGNRIERSLRFSWLGGNSRHPPIQVVRFVAENDEPPLANEVLPTMEEWISSQWRTGTSIKICQALLTPVMVNAQQATQAALVDR
jgi:hypothetical protein